MKSNDGIRIQGFTLLKRDNPIETKVFDKKSDCLDLLEQA